MQTHRVSEIIKWFGLEQHKRQAEIDIEIPPLARGQIMLIAGASGAGKSRLLKRIKNQWENGRTGERATRRWIDLTEIQLPAQPIVDCFAPGKLENVLLGLNRVGLAEAWDYIRPPAALSEGQKFRLRLALALARASKQPERRTPRNKFRALSVVACDEFCAILDRVTARIVARTLRRTIDHQKNVCAIVATSHDDLLEALKPDLVIRCDFGNAEIFFDNEARLLQQPGFTW